MWGEILAHKNYLVIFFTPLLSLPLPLLLPGKEALCGYAIILMSVFWCTEALPLGITSLLPIILFPLMGILDSTQVCQEYLKDTSMLFVGSLVIAISVEHWNLHKRIALRVLLIIGVRPAMLLVGFMGITAFLSMWINNTATTAMMVPIALAVLEELHKSERERLQATEGGSSSSSSSANGNLNLGFELQEPRKPQEGNSHLVTLAKEPLTPEDQQLKKKQEDFSKGLTLAVCYSSSIGGFATLTGTTPNLVLRGQVEELFPDNDNVVNFASWLTFAFPTSVLFLVLSWAWLQVFYLGFDFRKSFGCSANEAEKAGSRLAYEVIRREHRALGAMKFSESMTLALFILLVLLWFTRAPGFMPGWAEVAVSQDGHGSYITDTTVVLFMVLVLFCLPSELPGCRRKTRHGGGQKEIRMTPALLDWPTVNRKLAWDTILLMGSGFALAKGSQASGLSAWLGSKLTPLQSIPPAAIIFVVCLFIAAFTQFISNVTTTTLFLPILASMAQAICLNPLYVMFPCTLAASLAFMLPVATPPNSIAFSYGHLKTIDMIKAGSGLIVIGVLVITLAINTWAFPLFDLDRFPSWANGTTGQC